MRVLAPVGPIPTRAKDDDMQVSPMVSVTLDPVDFAALARAVPSDAPFRHLIVPGFISEATQEGIEADYPKIEHPGSFPLPSLSYGPRFAALIDSLTGSEMRRLVGEKLDIDLTNRPVT